MYSFAFCFSIMFYVRKKNWNEVFVSVLISSEVVQENQYLFANKHFKTEKIILFIFFLIIASVEVFLVCFTMNFYEAIKPFHLWSKISGITIFSVKSQGFSAKFRKVDFIFILLSIYGSFHLFKLFFSMFKSGYSDSKIIQESYPILLYGKFTINVLCITWTTLARNKILSIPRLLHEVDVMVREIKYFIT